MDGSVSVWVVEGVTFVAVLWVGEGLEGKGTFDLVDWRGRGMLSRVWQRVGCSVNRKVTERWTREMKGMEAHFISILIGIETYGPVDSMTCLLVVMQNRPSTIGQRLLSLKAGCPHVRDTLRVTNVAVSSGWDRHLRSTVVR
jgi:hypothetical protein